MGEATITGGQPVVGHSANFMSKDALPKHDGYGGVPKNERRKKLEFL